MFRTVYALAFALACLQTGAAGCGEPDLKKLEKQRCPKPKRFAIVFSFGYAGDLMPKDDAQFDKLLGIIKEAGFNTIHCTYTEKRLELCKKHDIQMMVDLLVEEVHHVYKSPDKAKAICEKLRGDPTVWGYNIWNDVYRKTTPGRVRDVYSVRQWDPTHPAYTGTYRTDGMRTLTNPDIFGYYDFHWKRGVDQHFPHLLAYSNWAKERDAWFYSWLAAESGIPGKGNFNRSLWSANTAIACGQKGILWFLATEMMDQKTFEWNETGKDIAKVNKELQPLANELANLANPTAIWSTPITRTSNNDPIPADKKDAMPPGLDKHGFPKDAFMVPESGEFLVGLYDAPAKGKGHWAYIVNHNAYAEQKITLRFQRKTGVGMFIRSTRKWVGIDTKDGPLRLTLEPGGAALVSLHPD